MKRTKKPKFLVIGDVMIDVYQYGEVNRISPEAPVPVVTIKKTVKNLGGAGNMFVNLYNLGATAMLIGETGKDVNGLTVIHQLMHDSCPEAYYWFHLNSVAPTIIKERVLAQTQQICRIDKEMLDYKRSLIAVATIDKVIKKELETADFVILSDYAKGFITKNIIETIGAAKKEKKFKVILDPHPNNKSIYAHIDYAVPNKKEFDEIGVESFWKMGCTRILRTEGADGMTLITLEGEHHISTVASDIFDVAGAGDTVCAVFTYCLSSGFSAKRAMAVSNNCAGIVVSKKGTVPITKNEFKKVSALIKEKFL